MNIPGINTILHRTVVADQITKILTNFETECKTVSFKKGIYIYGPSGCGKTRFVTDLLAQLNYDVVQFDAGDVRNKALIDSLTCDSISTRNVLEMMHRRKKNIAILMKEVESLNGTDRNCISQLIKLIRQKKTKKQKMENVTLNPILCIGNYYVDKKIKELMKVCHVFEIPAITDGQMQQLVSWIVSQSQSQTPTQKQHPHPKAMDAILHYVQGDLRKLEFIQTLWTKKPDIFLRKPGDTKHRALLETILGRKMFHEDAKQITKRLLQGPPIRLEEHTTFLNETDRTIISLLYHENVIDLLGKRSGSESESGSDYAFYLQFLQNLCFADYMDRITFQNQIWVFNEMSSLIKTFYNNVLLHQHLGLGLGSAAATATVTPTPSNVPAAAAPIRFTKVLTKYSTEYNNQLFLYNLCQALEMDKKDVVAFFQELRLFYGSQFHLNNEILDQVLQLFEETANIQRLDVKRIYRYLDKNVPTVVDGSSSSSRGGGGGGAGGAGDIRSRMMFCSGPNLNSSSNSKNSFALEEMDVVVDFVFDDDDDDI